ncbi:MAG: group III truncated hemoglobin [Beijerinckiaceae bacterium]
MAHGRRGVHILTSPPMTRHHPEAEHIRPPPAGVPAGVTEDMIRTLVHTFYGRVRQDEMLGPIFNAKIADWDAHLAKLCDFWSSVTLSSGRYKGQPVPAHTALPDIRAEHFARWLGLFGETARDVCPPDAAALFVDRAQRIAESLQIAIAMSRGEMTVRPPPRKA